MITREFKVVSTVQLTPEQCRTIVRAVPGALYKQSQDEITCRTVEQAIEVRKLRNDIVSELHMEKH
jgi:hypothetical protein